MKEFIHSEVSEGIEFGCTNDAQARIEALIGRPLQRNESGRCFLSFSELALAFVQLLQDVLVSEESNAIPASAAKTRELARIEIAERIRLAEDAKVPGPPDPPITSPNFPRVDRRRLLAMADMAMPAVDAYAAAAVGAASEASADSQRPPAPKKADNRGMEAATDQFLVDVEEEVRRARAKFPQPNPTLAAMTEEAGEVARQALHIREGKSKDWWAVYNEAVQLAAMACRIAIEGDPTVGAVPTEENAK